MVQMQNDLAKYEKNLNQRICGQIWDSAADITEIPVGVSKRDGWCEWDGRLTNSVFISRSLKPFSRATTLSKTLLNSTCFIIWKHSMNQRLGITLEPVKCSTQIWSMLQPCSLYRKLIPLVLNYQIYGFVIAGYPWESMYLGSALTDHHMCSITWNTRTNIRRHCSASYSQLIWSNILNCCKCAPSCKVSLGNWENWFRLLYPDFFYF